MEAARTKAAGITHGQNESGLSDGSNQLAAAASVVNATFGCGPKKRSRGLNFGKKGKKESQVFTSVADNPRQCIGSYAATHGESCAGVFVLSVNDQTS